MSYTTLENTKKTHNTFRNHIEQITIKIMNYTTLENTRIHT